MPVLVKSEDNDVYVTCGIIEMNESSKAEVVIVLIKSDRLVICVGGLKLSSNWLFMSLGGLLLLSGTTFVGDGEASRSGKP